MICADPISVVLVFVFGSSRQFTSLRLEECELCFFSCRFLTNYCNHFFFFPFFKFLIDLNEFSTFPPNFPSRYRMLQHLRTLKTKHRNFLENAKRSPLQGFFGTLRQEKIQRKIVMPRTLCIEFFDTKKSGTPKGLPHKIFGNLRHKNFVDKFYFPTIFLWYG